VPPSEEAARLDDRDLGQERAGQEGAGAPEDQDDEDQADDRAPVPGEPVHRRRVAPPARAEASVPFPLDPERLGLDADVARRAADRGWRRAKHWGRHADTLISISGSSQTQREQWRLHFTQTTICSTWVVVVRRSGHGQAMNSWSWMGQKVPCRASVIVALRQG